MQDLINQKQVELNLLTLAKFKCSECGLISIKDVYIAVNSVVCCNLCGSEIKE